MNKLILGFLCSHLVLYSIGQEHNTSANYTKPSDSLAQKNLSEWGDLKFGLFMHWGTYSQWGIVESWSLCPEDEDWTQRKDPRSDNYYEYVKAYENLQTQFNPVENYLLNIAPGPNGDWDTDAYKRLENIGEWINDYGEGIYNTRPVSTSTVKNIYFTQNKDENTVYAFLLNEDQDKNLPAKLVVPLKEGGKLRNVNMGSSGLAANRVKWKIVGKNIEIIIPKKKRLLKSNDYATMIKMKYIYL
ncbi:alpha-L-fucosidase [Olivibacter sp. SDN3]|uniref:alpha-L-fucosidase n=1 Tax=Olivibacter sp. SDN3 TaxID=2764720 RepID=UPI0016513BE4|nr:alpha-L-fucosidase [Olivibacter sp. SDN3]QNL48588.1 alpha-L-fucosidase [Olivibacter sp. SDN3]